MTDNEKYNELLKALGELLSDKNRVIKSKDWELEDLRCKLTAAEVAIYDMRATKKAEAEAAAFTSLSADE